MQVENKIGEKELLKGWPKSCLSRDALAFRKSCSSLFSGSKLVPSEMVHKN